jgi:hypothetical protein
VLFRSHAFQSNQPLKRGVHPRCHHSPNVNRPPINQRASELPVTGLPHLSWDCLKHPLFLAPTPLNLSCPVDPDDEWRWLQLQAPPSLSLQAELPPTPG